MTYLNYALSDFNTNKYAFISKHILKAKSCDSEFFFAYQSIKSTSDILFVFATSNRISDTNFDEFAILSDHF